MKKLLLGLCLVPLTMSAYASANCQDDFAPTHSEFETLRVAKDKSFLSKNWNNIPVIKDYDQGFCELGVDMELIKVKRNFFWMFRTTDDSCDGGNTYGVIYNYDLNKSVTTISDGDVECL